MRRLLPWFGFGFLSVLIAGAVMLWLGRATVESKILDKLIQKVSPALPFTIDSYHLGKNLDSFSLSITFHGEHIEIDGPLHWQWIKKDGIEIRYTPMVSISGATEFPLVLALHTERQWNDLEDLQLNIAPVNFVWKKYGIDTTGLSLNSSYDGDALHAEFKLGSATFTDPVHQDHAMSISEFQFAGDVPHVKTPFTFTAKASAKGSEVLKGDLYLDLPLASLPLSVQSDAGKTIDVGLGKDQLKLHAVLDADPAHFKTAKIDFKSKNLSIPLVMPWVIKNLSSIVPFLKTLADYDFKNGQLTAEGSATYSNTSKETFAVSRLKAKGNNFTFRSAEKKIAVKELGFDFDYLENQSSHAFHLQAKELYFRHFKAALKPSTLTWNANKFSAPSIPLSIIGVPLTIGKVEASLKPEFDLFTSMKLAPIDISAITNALCIAENKLPPIQVTGDFPEIEFSKSVIDPTGKFSANLFGGMIELNDLGIYDLDTEVPETDFDIDWNGIDLQKMGDWSHFGEIKGTLEGYAHDVVLQSFLPTQYHFLINVAPYDRQDPKGRVEFAPEAMKNVVKLFTGTDLDEQIPGIAGWMMFGWPSHVFGGYDVYYAGMKLTSEDGHIIVETLDKPAVFPTQEKHFVLYGPRFKMPLRNDTYPLVVDATSMSNFVHQLLTQFQSIKQKKEGSTSDEDSTTENPCNPPEL